MPTLETKTATTFMPTPQERTARRARMAALAAQLNAGIARLRAADAAAAQAGDEPSSGSQPPTQK